MFFRRRNALLSGFKNSTNYAVEILSLSTKVAAGTGHAVIKTLPVSLSAVAAKRSSLARTLARAVNAGVYEFQPAKLRQVMIRGKKRELYEFCFSDRIVHGAVARFLAPLVSGRLSPAVYSYQKGNDWYNALRHCAEYVRNHRHHVRDPHQRGLYVLRRDIKDYTATIPVGGSAPLWHLLKGILGEHLWEKEAHRIWQTLQAIIRPQIESPQGIRYSRICGIPTGSPIAAILYNLCAMPVDEAVANMEGAFYARYGDDLIFMHHDAAVVKEASQRISESLGKLGLKLNSAKKKDLFFNGAGKGSQVWPEAQGSQHVSFLGCRLSFHGTVALGAERTREFLIDVRTRIARTSALVAGKTQETRGRHLCATVNRMLEPHSPLSHESVLPLRFAITDRAQLRELDYQIALNLAEYISGVRGVRAFRAVSYQKLRQHWNLHSLCQQRNLH